MKKRSELGERDNLLRIYENEYNTQKKKEFENLTDLEINKKFNPYLEEVSQDVKKCLKEKCDKKRDTIKQMNMLINYINNICDSKLINDEDRLSTLQHEKKRIQKEIKKIKKDIDKYEDKGKDKQEK